jgi:hypothetical protein
MGDVAPWVHEGAAAPNVWKRSYEPSLNTVEWAVDLKLAGHPTPAGHVPALRVVGVGPDNVNAVARARATRARDKLGGGGD